MKSNCLVQIAMETIHMMLPEVGNAVDPVATEDAHSEVQHMARP